jgi:hypothetical protein
MYEKVNILVPPMFRYFQRCLLWVNSHPDFFVAVDQNKMLRFQ